MEPEKEDKEYDEVLSSYYKDQQVKAMITLKVDTKFADIIAAKVAQFSEAADVFLVTGDVDIIIKARFETYHDLKKFLVSKVGALEGVKETRTLMVVTSFKEDNKVEVNDESES